MNTLYLIRHGENTANLTREFSHRAVDYSLTPKGMLQAQQTAEYFKTRRVDAIYTSPLKRALETAQIVGHGGIFTFTLKDICGDIDLPTLIARPSRNCSITEIEIDEADGELRGVLKAWSSCSHLSGEALTRIIGHPAFDEE